MGTGYRATENLIAVMWNTREAAYNSGGVPDTTLQLAAGDIFTIDPKREDDSEEQTGVEGPTRMYDLGVSGSSASFSFDKCQPQHVAGLAAFGMGNVVTTAAGSGFLHTITPIRGDLDVRRSNPSFCGSMRYGDTVLKRRLDGLVVDSFTLSASVDSWLKITGQIKGSGKHADNIVKEIVSALDNVTELTLAANGVHGADADARIQGVQSIEAEIEAGVWIPVVVTAVSDATPAVITIESAGGAGTETISYRIIYRPVESEAWMTFPDRVQESPLRVSQVQVAFGGKWTGTEFKGGRKMQCELKSFEWSFNNNGNTSVCFGESGDYAGRYFRDGRSQTVKVDREFRDMVIQQKLTDNDVFGIHLLAEGAEYDTGHKFTVEVILPALGIKTATPGVDGKKLSESVELQVFDGSVFDSAIVRVKNLVDAYAAAA